VMEYEFTLKFAVPGTNAEEFVERLGAAGCTDALVGIGQPGRIALNFTREANSAMSAIASAIEDSRRAIPTAKFLEITPDFVGLSDVAELVDVSRQNMRKLMLKHAATFPSAVHEGSSAVWHLYPVLQWLSDHANYSVPQALFDVAHIAMQINLAKESKQLERGVQHEISELVA
jgi:predicted DNA-binding transcriptional regulator AlpA